MKKAAVSLALMFTAFTVIGGVVGGSKTARAVEAQKVEQSAKVDCSAQNLTNAQYLKCI